MEVISISMLISLVALFISLPMMFLLSRSKSQSPVRDSILPPGTYGWPMIGETLDFLKETFVEERMKKFSPQIFKTSLVGESVAVFCGPDGNKCLFSDEKKNVTRWTPRQLDKIFPLSTDPSDATKHKIYKGFLRVEALQSYVGIMDSIAKHQLKNSWETQREVHVFSQVKMYTFSLGCKLMLSIDDPIHVAKLHDKLNIVFKGFMSLPLNLYGTPFNKAIKASSYIRKDIDERIKQRKMELAEGKEPKDIFSQMFCTPEVGDEADTASSLAGLLVAGDASSVVITFIVKYLAELPYIYDQVLKEQREILKAKSPGEPLNWEDIEKMTYSWNVAREVLRLAAPTRGTFREAVTDITYAGFTVPKGWKLYWSNASHKNAKYFPDPEKFDPSRFNGRGPAPYTYVPFGGGPYMCPGKGYARLQILVFMHNLVTKFKWEKIIPDEKIVFASFPMLEKGLPIRLQPHAH